MTVVYRYLNDFSKALASEVRILLTEVGKLRDERRQLQLYVLFFACVLRISVHPFRCPFFVIDPTCVHFPDLWVHENKQTKRNE